MMLLQLSFIQFPLQDLKLPILHVVLRKREKMINITKTKMMTSFYPTLGMSLYLGITGF